MDSIGKVVIDSQVYYSADDIKSKARVFAGSARNPEKWFASVRFLMMHTFTLESNL